jgi:hypothetical protein
MRAVGDFITRTAQTPFIDMNMMNLWDEMVLTLAIEVRDHQSQAETYLSMSKNNLRGQVHRELLVLAFACYDITGHIPSHIVSPKGLNVHSRRRARPFRDTLMTRYQRIGDEEIQAYILLAFGEWWLWSKYYDEAREDLEQAHQRFQTLNAPDRQKRVLLYLMRLAHRIQDYDLYRDTHAQAVALVSPTNPQEGLTLWLDMATVAVDYWDWRTARTAYQRAAMMAVSLHEPQRQCRIYWQWGQMEYKAQRFAAGEALCLWSIALVQQYDPDQVGNYQRELKQIRIRETQ